MRRWDRDARVAAWEQAQDASARDPDAAAHLLDCLAADPSADSADSAGGAEGDENGDESGAMWDDGAFAPPASGGSGGSKPFDLMRMLAHVAKYYGWSDESMMRMPWKRFLAYAREADIMAEEEKAALDAEMARGRNQYGGARGQRGAPGGPGGIPGYPTSYPSEYPA